MKLFPNLIYFVLIPFVVSCVSPYTPDISKYENLLVVDGELTNLPGPYEVKLSRSFKFHEKTADPVTGAEVKIVDKSGSEVELRETSDGIYSTVDTTFRGVAGHSYKLQIKAGDNLYESEYETIKNPVPIDQVYWEYKVPENQRGGIQLLLDTHDPTNSSRYYAWKYDETWKFIVPIELVAHPDWKVCYAQSHSTNFNIATSARRYNDIIERQPLCFFGENTNRLYIRYTTLVRQYVLSEPTYKFFKDVITVNQNQGTLFDPIPSATVGNLRCITHGDIPVLGYFLVAGATEKRIFIDRKDLPEKYRPTDGFEDCGSQNVLVPIKLQDVRLNPVVDSLMKRGYEEYERYVVVNPPDTFHQLNMAKAPCFNCLLNGVNVVPEYWREYPQK